MAPISLNEGKGEMVVPALVVLFLLSLKRRLADGWAGGGGTSRRASGQPKRGNAKMPFSEGGDKEMNINKTKYITKYYNVTRRMEW